LKGNNCEIRASTFVMVTTTCFMLRVHGKTNGTRGRHQPACDNFTYQLPNRLKKKIEAINIK